MKNYSIKFGCILIQLYSFVSYCQTSFAYSTIETKNVLHYEVKEIVKMNFGATTTSYTVSDLRLIKQVDLGPNNIRIITPIYINEKLSKKNYYVETKNLKKEVGTNQKPTNLTEIKIDSKNIVIPENARIEKEALAIVMQNLIASEPYKVVKNTATGKKLDYIEFSTIETYERVAEKGYKSIYIFKELGNHFYFKENMEKAVIWYEELFAMAHNLDPVFYYRFGDALRKTGKKKRGEAMIDQFNSLSEK